MGKVSGTGVNPCGNLARQRWMTPISWNITLISWAMPVKRGGVPAAFVFCAAVR